MRRALLLSCAAIVSLATGPAPAAPQITTTTLPGVASIDIRTGANSTIAFRITAPNAKDVRVFVDTMPQSAAQPLVRDDKGVWTGTLGPLEPDIYPVACVVDGAMAIAGYTHVTGPVPQAWDPRKVPHGAVHQRWYDSRTLGVPRSVYVYTPPDYDRGSNVYPTLYLLHGSGGVEASWILDGLANVILDNLIADGQAKPMVVVMPFGHPSASVRIGNPADFTRRDMGEVSRDLIDDVMPMIERLYRVRRDPDQRAIAGLSMGGNQARQIGLNRLDLFHYVATFSGSMGVPAARSPTRRSRRRLRRWPRIRRPPTRRCACSGRRSATARPTCLPRTRRSTAGSIASKSATRSR